MIVAAHRRSASRTVLVTVTALGIVAIVAVVGWIGRGDPTPRAALPPPHFVDDTGSSGIDHAYDGEFTFFVGGGVAAFDCNADHQPDLYLAGGAGQASLYQNESPIGGALRFTRLPAATTDLTDVVGAYPLDIDSDGHLDLAVLRLGENVLLRGLGDCRFERANEAWQIDGDDEWTAAFSATWEAGETLPTLAFGNYVRLDEEGRQVGECSPNALVRPGSAERYAEPIPLDPGWCTLSILFSDWDRSGRRDLRMTNDRHYYRDGEEQLWRVATGEAPRLYAREEGWKKMQIWGMGIASHDLTGDGRPEVFLTSQGDNKLQTLTGDAAGPNYTDIAIRSGATAHRPYTDGAVLPSTAWHAEFQDVNNDAFVDLFISKGNVEAMPDFAAEDPNNLLMGGPDGVFTEAGPEAGIVDFARTRGATLADFNLDGLLDLVEVNRRENVEVWRNVGSGTAEQPQPIGNWLAIRLNQPGPNPAAVGAWIEVKIGDLISRREHTVGGGHAGGQIGWLHFGTGLAERAEIRVQWPDGETGPWLPVQASRFVVIDRETESAGFWTPGG